MHGYCAVCGMPTTGMHHEDGRRDSLHEVVRWRSKDDARYVAVFTNGRRYGYIKDLERNRYLCISMVYTDTAEDLKRTSDDTHRYLAMLSVGTFNPDSYTWTSAPI